jgi:hypothetical protein
VVDIEFLGHSSHDDSPFPSFYVPGLHFRQESVAKIPPILGPNVPAGHSLHFVCSIISFYVPALHFLQLFFPVPSCYVPLGQSSGAFNPLVEH